MAGSLCGGDAFVLTCISTPAAPDAHTAGSPERKSPMQPLTDLLRDQHVQMRRLLDEVRQLGIGKEAGRERLRQARSLIVEHLRQEGAELYPSLHRNDATQALAQTYAVEMRQLSGEILAFFDSWQHGGDDLAFARHYGRLMGLLNRRWTREEVRLYPAYERHCLRSDAA